MRIAFFTDLQWKKYAIFVSLNRKKSYGGFVMDVLNLEAFSQIVTLTKPHAIAVLRGNDANPQLGGSVRFYPAAKGTLVVAEVFGLPPQVMDKGAITAAGPFYAFHIHEGGQCGASEMPDPFKSSMSHYNPADKPHPVHAGDLPPLLGNSGYAYLATYTGGFTPEQVVGRTAIIHSRPDDFITQPSGNAGQKIACGEIKRV